MNNRIVRGHSKPKRNPAGKCILCKKKVFNKLRGSLYCKEHDEDIRYIQGNLTTAVYRLRHKCPQYNIKYIVKISLKAKH